jgi:hypothetical protein
MRTRLVPTLSGGTLPPRVRCVHIVSFDLRQRRCNQASDQADARIARIRADLHLTTDQENNWGSFESAYRDINQGQAEREASLRTDGSQQKGPVDVIEQMRRGADSMTAHAGDQKKLADAAQPLFASLNDQQKRRLSEVLVRIGNEREPN